MISETAGAVRTENMALDTQTKQARLNRALANVVAACAAAWAFGHVAALALLKHFTVDEFQYAHSAWLISKGQIPYRDFFEVHFPLVYQFLSPVFLLTGNHPGNILYLRMGMLIFFGMTVAASVYITGGGKFRPGGWVCAMLLAGTWPFARFAAEIRPDPAAYAFFVCALAILYNARLRPSLRGFWSGLFLLAAVWGSQKVLLYGAVFALVFLLSAVPPGRIRRASALGSPLAFLLGFCIGASFIAVYLLVTGSADEWWYWCFQWAYDHQKHYPGFSWQQYLEPVLRAFWYLLLLGIPMWLFALLQLVRNPASLHQNPDTLLVLALPFTFLSYAAQRAPFPYSLVPFLGILCIFTARALVLLWPRILNSPRPANLILLIVTGSVAALWLVDVSTRAYERLRPRNRGTATDFSYQMTVFDDIARVTNSEDAGYDNSGGYITRPHAYFYFYTDNYLRISIADQLAQEVPAAIEKSGCVLNLHDVRTSQHRLPRSLEEYLARNFQPYTADIHLWGRHYRMPPGSTLLKEEFRANKGGDYFVEPADLLVSGTLLLDGSAVEGPVFTMEKGPHQLEYRGPPADFYILWLPRDRKRYTPRPDLKLEPKFSRVF